jgi:hypothetical protein
LWKVSPVFATFSAVARLTQVGAPILRFTLMSESILGA